MNKSLFAVGIVVAIVIAFCGGAYYAATGGWLPAGFGLGGQHPESAGGQIESLQGSTITLRLYDGTVQTYTVDQNTAVLMLSPAVPKSLQDLTVGASASVVPAGNRAVMIQIFSTSSPAAPR